MANVPHLNRRRRALLSVTNKSGLVEFAKVLGAHDYALVASGGTARHLREHDCDVTEVSDLTGFPEAFGGRVKTLHPLIHGGILGQREEDFDAVSDLGIKPIDLVCVNLYRFEDAVTTGGEEAELLEQIDIGGPSLLRAAAKNFPRVTVLCDPDFYSECTAELQSHGGDTSLEFRRRMAAATFVRITAYNQAIASWLGGSDSQASISGDIPAERLITLRYGENPHQKAWLEMPPDHDGKPNLSSIGLQQLGGKELSYNNLVDLVAALKLVCDFTEPCCAVIKHTNPCGFGLGDSKAALERALLADPVSAFGGVFAFNNRVELSAAERLGKMFYEIVAAPAYSEDALAKLRKKKNVRIIRYESDAFMTQTVGKSRSFGKLVLHQEEDSQFPELEEWTIAAGREPDPDLSRALTTMWKVCKHGKSNAIVIGDENGTLGVGFGQMSRVDSVLIAIRKAGDQKLPLKGAVAASDGFFPFPDGVETLAAAGVVAVIAPGGSIRDEEVAASAQKLGMTLIFSGRRHFNH